MEQIFPDVQFPGWNVIRKLGEGSFGGVYEIQRVLPDGTVERAALKKLAVPRDHLEVEELISQSFTTESITAHYKDQMSSLVREYNLMQEMGSCANVVSCHDIQYIQQPDGIGWDVYIRMDLLQPLKKTLDNQYREENVIRLGLDICTALIACQKKNIIHRDIKPENILVSPDGLFELTDFGIAKVSEKTGSGTLAGTGGYMAPEVGNRQRYGASVDLYSLGMVLYWMMNQRTLPFLPLPPEIPTAFQRQTAIDRRLSGEELPLPANGSDGLWKIVRKACAFSPENRYKTPREMYNDLAACGAKETVFQNANTSTEPSKGEFREQDTVIEPKNTPSSSPKPRRAEPIVTAHSEKSVQKERRRRKKAGVFAAFCLIMISAVVGFMNIHFWTEGSCTEPVKCKLCGKIKSDAPGHQWVEATCTAPRYCDVCGETSGEALGHRWVEATCTSAKYCSVCGELAGAPLGHQWENATYDTPKHCIRCGLTEGTLLTTPKPKLNTGSGTASDPYRLRTPENLEMLRNEPNAYYRLENDIDFGGETFTPIGEFGGVLDGNGHAIQSVTFKYISGANNKAASLIVNVLKSGIVENLVLECEMNAGILERTDSAGITICNEGIIRNCKVKVNFQNSYAVGGITRNNTISGQIEKCVVNLTASSCNFVGGIAEYQSGIISDCTATVQVTGGNCLGGIAYANAGTIEKSNSDGLSQSSATIGCMGGIVGENLAGGEIQASTSTVKTETGKKLPAVGN